MVGLDAYDPWLLQRWAADGTLPTFRRLLAGSLCGPTTSPTGLFVGAVWPSFATGVSPARHGRYCYRQLAAGTYRDVMVHPDSVIGDPFWVPFSRAGRRVVTIDIPKIPPARGCDARQVVDWASHDRDFDPAVSHPAGLIREIQRRFGRDPVGTCDRHGLSAAAFGGLVSGLVRRCESKGALVEHLIEADDWDLLAVVFAESHCVGHQCWHLHDPSHPRHDAAIAAAIGDPLRTVYAALDTAVGRLLAAAGEDTTVIVLASHGMGPHYDASFLLDEILARLDPGAGAAAGHDGGPLAALRRAWRLLPEPAARLLRPLRRTLGVRVESRRTARRRRGRSFFAVPNNDAWGAVRVNLRGREAHGRIAPGAELDAVSERLESELREIVNVTTGEALVRDVVRADRLFSGPRIGDLPDLLIEWNRSAPISAVSSGRIGTVRGEYHGIRTGDHHGDGMFFATGAGVAAGRSSRAVSVMDFAPTLARLLGVAGVTFEGEPIEGLG
jgi:predicted AlkP superfamily phosphohydrolase/phosphomutase